jgi:L-fuculose-phosphate aldolase
VLKINTVRDTESSLRSQLLHYAQSLQSSGLSVGKSGNISVRHKNGFLITPSGVDYQALNPNDLVWMDHQGRYDANTGDQTPLAPSSEWHFHCGLYQARPDINAVLHCHSSYCTALACTGRTIPAFHYMVAIAGGVDIPIAPYALFGTQQLSQSVVNTLQQRLACLLANHGMITLGADLDRAFNLALEVENLAQQYCLALQIGDVKLLSTKQMNEALERFASYGQRV